MNVDMIAKRIDICQYVCMASVTPTPAAANLGPEDQSDLCCTPLFTDEFDEAAAVEVASILKAIADPVRLRLLSIIGTAADGEACACDLPALVDRSQPTVSHHLRQLVNAGILDREQRGKWAWFSINNERLDTVCQAISSNRC